MMTDETTTEQLAEIDRDMADIDRQVAELVEEAQQADYKTQELPTKTQELETKTQELPAEYTPPEGWRVLAVGEILQAGDMWVWPTDDGRRYPTHRIGDAVGPNRQYIRRIKPQPQPESDTELQAQVTFLKNREVTLGTRLQQEREVTTRLRGELESVQNLLGTERQRVTQLEELVASLRNINVTQEKAFTAAGKENTALRNQLAAVKAELANVAADRQQLRVELDAAQQVPADSPELRQLRADLAEVTQDRDTYRHAHELLLADANAGHARTKAMTVEAIVEWLEPVRATIEAADNVQQTMRADNLACDIIRNLPGILRYVVGLDSPEDVE